VELLTGFSLFLTEKRPPESIVGHKSCAVKFYAYTLDNSENLASALQQSIAIYAQPAGIACLPGASVIRAEPRQLAGSSNPID
jgi:hypothetical protein